MYTDFLRGLSWLADHGWVAPLVGVLMFGVALLAGRRLASGRPRATAEEAEGPIGVTDYLKGLPTDRRAAPRRRVGNAVEVRLDDGSGGEPAPGYVLNRSIGGLGVLTHGPVEVGAVLRVYPRDGYETARWVEVTVRSCKRKAGQYEVGCQFQRTPDWNLLLQFG